MASSLRAVLTRLLPLGWQSVLARHGLAIPMGSDDTGFRDALTAELPVDRTVPGFEDFAGSRGVEPGDPARSLLFHAFAHPAVQLPGRNPEAYPTLNELEAVENAIWDLGPAPGGGELAVLAYEYRPAAKTGHQQHADFVFSRTGIARVGTAPAVWDPLHRCFTPGPSLAVHPARYAVFEVEVVDASAIARVGREATGDEARSFLRPVRKLTGDVAWGEAHRSERLHRMVTVGQVELAGGFDADAAPLVRDSGLVELRTTGASALLHSRPAPLVRPATQHNADTGRTELLRFTVPPERGWLDWLSDGPNRRYTSLRLPHHFFTDIADALLPEGSLREATTAFGSPRNGPVYVNIRYKVEPDPVTGEPALTYLDETTPDLEPLLDAGGYEAAMFEDSLCEGCITARVGDRDALPAFSLVCAPDFFPLADGADLLADELQEHFLNGNPAPLCEGRLPANPDLVRPDGSPAFTTHPTADTVVAAVSRPASRDDLDPPVRLAGPTSALPDAASGVYAPGWDVTYASHAGGVHYTTWGLGSPFLEDVKLCAAANGMWPAASPDAARTFQGGLKWTFETPTAIPLLDDELGWDDVDGPRFETHDDRLHIEFADVGRADYVAAAMAGKLDGGRLRHLDSAELIDRMDALRLCIHALSAGEDERVSRTDLWLVVARATFEDPGVYDTWTPPSHQARYLFAFARPAGNHELTSDTSLRRRQPCGPVYTCLVSPTQLHWTDDGATWQQESA